ncbi:hypothetical protein D3C77_367590 [compost metagenome]
MQRASYSAVRPALTIPCPALLSGIHRVPPRETSLPAGCALAANAPNPGPALQTGLPAGPAPARYDHSDSRPPQPAAEADSPLPGLPYAAAPIAASSPSIDAAPVLLAPILPHVGKKTQRQVQHLMRHLLQHQMTWPRQRCEKRQRIPPPLRDGKQDWPASWRALLRPAYRSPQHNGASRPWT